MSAFAKLADGIVSRTSIAFRRYQDVVESVGADVASVRIDSACRIESSGDDAANKTDTMTEMKTMALAFTTRTDTHLSD